jgi:glycosyltransferase involved in cell wall biosynthesis
MLKGIIEKGIEPLVVLPEYGELCEYFNNEGIKFKVFRYFFSRYPPFKRNNILRDMILYMPRLFKMVFFNSIAIGRICGLVKKFKPDIIHSNTGPIHIGFYVAKKLDVPHVWHLREYQILDFSIYPFPSMRQFKSILLLENNYNIAITKNIYDYFLLKNNSAVIYNGVLSSEDKILEKIKGSYFLFAGSLSINKGVNDLIYSFYSFSKINKEYKLFIAGDTGDKKYKKMLLNIVKKYGLTDRIIFLGMRDDIYDLMSKATALIVPSLFEGFGRITVEAMFTGCLVIGYNSAGTKEILEPEGLGLLYTSNDELVRIMLEVIEKGIEQYFPLIEKAQRRAVELYSIEQNVNAVYDFYIEIMKKSRRFGSNFVFKNRFI